MNEKMAYEIQEANEHAKNIEEQLKVVEQQIAELRSFGEGIEFLDKSKENEILASIGKGVFIKSEIKDRKLFVDVGSGIFVRKSIDDAAEISKEQIKRLNEMKIQLISEMNLVNEGLRELVSSAEIND